MSNGNVKWVVFLHPTSTKVSGFEWPGKLKKCYDECQIIVLMNLYVNKKK